ncbi:16S rRNA (cytosine(1402)-N(4))-methyltransferase RsmH [Candidatus Nomurabacteria bacterium]|nr:16S rRNA (cytosine(1402)-N(4))-methyltransferase RsmH [Candidatus Nomurabacteria bacterium]
MVHEPVLLKEVMTGLDVHPGEILLDLTVNRGGHSRELCRQLASHGHLIGIDADAGALKEATDNLKICPCPVTLLEGNFRDLTQIIDGIGIGKVDAILADLGLSSQQLDESDRGFSFQRDEPLNMNLSHNTAPGSLTAYQIVNFWQETSLADVIFGYGEERFARRIAKAIVSEREVAPISTTQELVAVIKSAIPLRYQNGRRHPATKTFQALRITVNDELGSLSAALESAWSRLNRNGRFAIITFHSLEARLVKNFFRERVKERNAELLTKHAVRPTREEVLKNPRSRSAQLRIIKKL